MKTGTLVADGFAVGHVSIAVHSGALEVTAYYINSKTGATLGSYRPTVAEWSNATKQAVTALLVAIENDLSSQLLHSSDEAQTTIGGLFEHLTAEEAPQV